MYHKKNSKDNHTKKPVKSHFRYPLRSTDSEQVMVLSKTLSPRRRVDVKVYHSVLTSLIYGKPRCSAANDRNACPKLNFTIAIYKWIRSVCFVCPRLSETVLTSVIYWRKARILKNGPLKGREYFVKTPNSHIVGADVSYSAWSWSWEKPQMTAFELTKNSNDIPPHAMPIFFVLVMGAYVGSHLHLQLLNKSWPRLLKA